VIDLFVIGGSAGAIAVLRQIASHLDADFPAPICIVVHIAPDSPGYLAEIIASAGPLPSKMAEDGEKLRAGTIYLARPDRHLIVDAEKRLRLGKGPKENLFRPAIDPLFRSAARFAPRVAGIVLSGGLDDGAAGLAAIKARGGFAWVQDPGDAHSASMPRAAIRATPIDRLLQSSEIGGAMNELARAPATSEQMMTVKPEHDLEFEIAAAFGAEASVSDLAKMGAPSLYACPDCHGAMVRLKAPGPERFRCHTGHAYTIESLRAATFSRAEEALLSAVRSMEEYAALLAHIAADHAALGERDAGAQEVRANARLVRTALDGLMQSRSEHRAA
jgi:two-component system, chemotaxis family, protein-glutamate methylesterase/glutaminase